jgi:uncharacterized protein (TIGR03067 family)
MPTTSTIHPCCFAILFLAFLPRFSLAQDKPEDTGLASLQGSWTAIEAESNGTLIEDAAFWREKKILKLTDAEFKLVLADGTFEGTVRVNSEASPKQITFVIKRDTELRGIYALKDDQLTLCWTIWIEDKQTPERPVGFATRKGEFKFVFKKDAETKNENPAADTPSNAKSSDTKKADSGKLIKTKLDRVKSEYESDLKKLQTKMLTALDRKESDARKDGNKKLVDQIESERKALEELQLLPVSIPTREYEVGIGKARQEMKAAYGVAIKDYTRQRLDTEASSAEKELNLFLADEFNFQGRWKIWHKKSDWKGEREVTREDIVDLPRKTDVKATWRRAGTTLRVTWPGGGWEELAIDPKNPNRLSGGNGKQGVQWDRVVAPQKKK